VLLVRSVKRKSISRRPSAPRSYLAEIVLFIVAPVARLCLDLTECEIEQIRVETVGLLQTMLAGQIGLPELPASLEQPRDAAGPGLLVDC